MQARAVAKQAAQGHGCGQAQGAELEGKLRACDSGVGVGGPGRGKGESVRSMSMRSEQGSGTCMHTGKARRVGMHVGKARCACIRAGKTRCACM